VEHFADPGLNPLILKTSASPGAVGIGLALRTGITANEKTPKPDG
jgi:hypothetical protein